MPTYSATTSDSSSASPALRTWKPLASLCCLLLAFLLLQCLLPLRTAVLIGADEGFEVAKATLSLKGCKLYADIWNDQPPLHTFLLTRVIQNFSSTMLGPRLLTSVFAMVLLSSVFVLFWRYNGKRVATLATLLLLVSPGFFLLASSCMLEIPALAPTMTALAVLTFGNRGKWLRVEVLAGFLFGIATEIKLISLIMLPVAGLLLWFRRRPAAFSGWNLVKCSLVLLAAMIVSAVAVDFMTCHGEYLVHFQQSWSSHFGGIKSLDYGSPDDHRFDWMALLRNWDLTVPASIGVGVCLARVTGSPAASIPALWLVYNLLLFGVHRPWWNYYYVHTAIPLCWCAAIGIDALWTKLRWPQQRLQCVAMALCAVGVSAWLIERMVLQIQSVRHSTQTYSCLFLNEMKRYQAQARWLYAEEPIYSFHAGIPLVPDLAVVVPKRFWAGELTDAQVAEDLKSAKPELILLKNDTRPRPFRDLLNTQYRLVYMDSKDLLYVLKTMARTPGH